MTIIQRINNNAALGVDGNGNELVVLGTGVGFPAVPYELRDLSRVTRTFYDIDRRYVEMIDSIRPPILMASADIVEQAQINLDCPLNPNLPFTLADHLQFTIERVKNGVDIPTPLAYDVQHLYPQEYDLGLLALDVLQDYTGVRPPDKEAVSVALHLINAEVENSDIHEAMLAVQVISEVDTVVEQDLGIVLDRSGFHYSRFTMHLRYLIQRLSSGSQVENMGGNMLRTLAREYPEIYNCAKNVARQLKANHGWQCNDDEVLYMMMHINRLWEGSRKRS